MYNGKGKENMHLAPRSLCKKVHRAGQKADMSKGCRVYVKRQVHPDITGIYPRVHFSVKYRNKQMPIGNLYRTQSKSEKNYLTGRKYHLGSSAVR